MSRIALIVASAAALATSTAAAKPPADIVTKPIWTQRPDGGDMAKFYPAHESPTALDGKATVECSVADDGGLTNCVIVSEAPTNAGFGDATRSLAMTHSA